MKKYLSIILLIAVALTGCRFLPEINYLEVGPVITPAGATYTTPVNVSFDLSGDLPEKAQIYFTLDGSDPTYESKMYDMTNDPGLKLFPKIEEGTVVNNVVTLRAIMVAPGFVASDSTDVTYTIDWNPSDDVTAPVINNGELTLNHSVCPEDVAELGFIFEKAADEIYPKYMLEYQAYYVVGGESMVAGWTIADWQANATQSGIYEADVNEVKITGLTPELEYTIAVIVRDPSGNKAIYSTATETTLPAYSKPQLYPGEWYEGELQRGESIWLVFDVEGNKNYQIAWHDRDWSEFGYYDADIQVIACRSENDWDQYWTSDYGSEGNNSVWTDSGATQVFLKVQAFDYEGAEGRFNIKFEEPDTTAPIPGNGGDFTIPWYGEYQADIQWTKATDNLSWQWDLYYEVFISETNDWGSGEEAVDNWSMYGLSMGQTWGDDYMTIYNLNPDTTYFVNIMVHDTDGNRSMYNTQSFTTNAEYTGTDIRLYQYSWYNEYLDASEEVWFFIDVDPYQYVNVEWSDWDTDTNLVDVQVSAYREDKSTPYFENIDSSTGNSYSFTVNSGQWRVYFKVTGITPGNSGNFEIYWQ